MNLPCGLKSSVESTTTWKHTKERLQTLNRIKTERQPAQKLQQLPTTERTPNGHRTGNTTEEEKPNGDRTDSVSVNDSVNVSVNDIECVSVAETPAEPAPEPAPTKKRFVAPTLEEIREFCFEKNININVDKFFYYYESKGWKVGVTPMKDWKAAVRNWAKNDTLYQQRPGSVRISSDIELLKNYTPPQTQTDVMANLAEIKGESTNAEEDTIIF